MRDGVDEESGRKEEGVRRSELAFEGGRWIVLKKKLTSAPEPSNKDGFGEGAKLRGRVGNV
jgi:hypothetical protein